MGTEINKLLSFNAKSYYYEEIKSKHYFILFALCVAVVTVVVALTLGRDLAVSVLLTGVIGLVGFIIGNFVGKKSADEKKQPDARNKF